MTASRLKKPELLRVQILEATQQVLLEEGLAALTQERVLAKLCLSKGGLQHHFRTKQQLLDGLFERLMKTYVDQYKYQLVQEPMGPARHIRAYVRTAQTSTADGSQDGKAITLLAIDNPHYQAEWSGFLEQMFIADSLDRANQLACRLFADGLWFSSVLGPPLDTQLATEAIQKIFQLTQDIA